MAASGSYTLTTEGITLHGGGQRVFLEIYVAEWDIHLLQAWEVGIDSSGYSSGSAGVLSPAYETCTGNAECVGAFGTGATCGYYSHDNECTPGFIGFNRADYVFANVSDLSAVDLATLNYRYGSAVVSSAVLDPGVHKYAGTLDGRCRDIHRGLRGWI